MGDDDLLAGIDRWLAEAAAADRAADAAAERAAIRRHAEARSAEDDLPAALRALADAAERLTVVLRCGRELQGRAVALGADFVVVQDGAEAAPAFVAHVGVAAVRLRPGRAWSGGVSHDELEVGRLPASRGSLRAVLAGLAGERPRVQPLGAGAPGTGGTLTGVGADHLVVAADGPGAATTLVPLVALDAVVLLDWR